MVHIPVVAPPLVPAPVAPVYAQPEVTLSVCMCTLRSAQTGRSRSLYTLRFMFTATTRRPLSSSSVQNEMQALFSQPHRHYCHARLLCG